MTGTSKSFLIMCLVAGVLCRQAQAHSSLESTDSLWIRTTGLDAAIYMSRGSATDLIAAGRGQPPIVRDNFSAYQKQLEAAGPGLLALSGDDGVVIVAETCEASMTDEDDICFRLHFPLPKRPLGMLMIHAAYLKKLTIDHVGSMYVLDEHNALLGQGDVTMDAPDFSLRLAPPTAASQPTAGNPPSEIALARPGRATAWMAWGAACAGGLSVVCAVLLMRARRRRGSSPRIGQ